jgi:hypothetical protein
MNFVIENWQLIVGIIVAIAVAVILVILYRKEKINEEYLKMLEEYLDSIDDGDGIVPLLAQYAKKAVIAVEQMVKAGVLPKENEARKNMAMRIVGELATADGIELNEADKAAADSLVEAAVFEIKDLKA